MVNIFLTPYTAFKKSISSGHARSVRAKKNILGSFITKGLSIGIALLLVPLTIDYINPSRYGIWLTISSIVGWFSFFDIGLTQGLRNKFATAKVKGDDDLAQIYVSTTYATLAIIFGFVWLCFFSANFFLNWSSILKVDQAMRAEISLLVMIVFSYFCLQFILKIVSTLIIADQQPAKASVIDLIGQIMSLTIIVILKSLTEGSLINLGLALCISPIVVLIGANLYFFRGKYYAYRPVFSKVKFSYAKGLFNLGVIFFIIQIAAITQFESANFIISRNFGTAEVTSYNIVYKYFGILQMASAIFVAPFWSASTEAYLKNETDWIKNSMKRYNYLNLVLVAVGLIMLLLSQNIYSLWLGKGTVKIDFWLSASGFLFFSVFLYGAKYVSFLNGIGALRIQFWCCIFSPFLYVALAMLFINYFHMGVYALFLAAVIANFNGYIIAPIQYKMIIYRNKKGIWLK